MINLFCSQLHGQTPVEGLIDNFNAFVFKDSRGFTWITSLGGLNRYDGHRVRQYLPEAGNDKALQEGLIQSTLYEDRNSDLWFVTTEYLYRYNRHTDDFRKFSNPEDSVGFHRIIDKVDEHLLHIQVGDRLHSFNMQSFQWTKVYDGFEGVYAVMDKDEKGEVIFIYATRNVVGGGALRLELNEGKGARCDTIAQGYYTGPLLKKDGLIWMPVGSKLMKMSKDRICQYLDGPDGNIITDVIAGPDSNLLLVSTKTDMYQYNVTSNRFKSLLTDTDYTIDFMFNLGNSELYFASTNVGLFSIPLFKKKPWGLLGTNDSPLSDMTIYGQEENESIVYSNIQNDLFIYNLTNNRTIHIDLDCPARFISNLKNDYFILCGQTLMSLDLKTGKLNRFGQTTAKMVNCVIQFEDKFALFDRSCILILDKSGKLISKKYKDYYLAEPYLIENRVFAIGEHGIYELDGSANELDSVNIFPFQGAGSQLSLVEDSLLYVAHDKGLYVMEMNSKKNIHHYFQGKFIQSFVRLENGELWAGTQGGLYRRKPGGEIYFYNEDSGLPADIFLENRVRVSADGRLWWGTTKGVLYFHPDSIKIEEYDAPIRINSFKIDGHEWADDTINVEEISTVELESDQNTLTFSLATTEYDPDIKPQYRVFLSGHDVDTIDLADQRIITYPNLDPGQYSFLYSSSTLSGIQNKNFESFDILIHPPFWQTWWFRLAMCLLGIGLVIEAIRFYIRNQLREQKYIYDKQQLILKNELQLQKERNRIADELHDELGGKLSSIKFAGKKVQRANTIEEVKSINNRVSELSTELIDSMRSIIWAMDTHNDTLSSLLANIRQYASTLAKDNELNIKFDFPKINEEVVVKGQIRHHLYLAIKEILNNILKHSRADQVIITSSIEADQIHISIWENGQGFETEPKQGAGKGLKSIRKRIGLIDGTLQYDQTSGVNTMIRVPL